MLGIAVTQRFALRCDTEGLGHPKLAQHVLGWAETLAVAIFKQKNGIADIGSHVQVMQGHNNGHAKRADQR